MMRPSQETRRLQLVKLATHMSIFLCIGIGIIFSYLQIPADKPSLSDEIWPVTVMYWIGFVVKVSTTVAGLVLLVRSWQLGRKTQAEPNRENFPSVHLYRHSGVRIVWLLMGSGLVLGMPLLLKIFAGIVAITVIMTFVGLPIILLDKYYRKLGRAVSILLLIFFVIMVWVVPQEVNVSSIILSVDNLLLWLLSGLGLMVSAMVGILALTSPIILFNPSWTINLAKDMWNSE